MKEIRVLLLNGSPRANGNTALALREMEKVFAQNGVQTETVLLGNQAIRGCTACGGSFGDFLSDCATIDCDELIRRHLGADPASDAFWTDAATEALNVMRDADRHIQSFIS